MERGLRCSSQVWCLQNFEADFHLNHLLPKIWYWLAQVVEWLSLDFAGHSATNDDALNHLFHDSSRMVAPPPGLVALNVVELYFVQKFDQDYYS